MTRFWPPLITLALICGGCSSPVDGRPSPAAAPQLPPRPRVVRVDGIDPCRTLTAAQLQSLGVRYSGTDEPRATRGPGCEWTHSPAEPIESYGVAINTHGGVEVVFGQPQFDVTTIGGFGAVESPGQFSTGADDCFIHVDVAPGEAVQVGYFYDGTTVPMTHAVACQKARHAAELAMQTILTQV